MSSLELGCRVLAGVVALAALVGKVRGGGAWRAFVVSLRPLAAGRAAGALAVSIATAEAGTVVLLAVPDTVTAGFVAATCLYLAFTAGVALILRGGRAVTCNCFGAGGGTLAVRHLLRNAVLLAGAVTGLLAALTVPAAPAAAGTVAAAGIALLAATACARIDDIAYLVGTKTADT